MELTKIKGIGPKTEKLFNKLGVMTCEDLVRYDAYMPPAPPAMSLSVPSAQFRER